MTTVELAVADGVATLTQQLFELDEILNDRVSEVIGRLIGGTLIVESVFALPGIGRLLVGAIYTRDLIILQGVVLLVAVGFVVVNFIVDLLYAILDPRIRHGHA